LNALILPESLRDDLKAPLGTLYRCSGIDCVRKMEKDLRSARSVIAVGDITAFYLLEASVMPDLIIVDHKTKRAPIEDHVKHGIRTKGGISSEEYRTVEVDNPAATLTGPFIEIIKKSLGGCGKTEIVVRGEEDLAALPVILYAPLGSVVVYGQPGEGSVIVKVTPEKKEQIKSLMDKMIVED